MSALLETIFFAFAVYQSFNFALTLADLYIEADGDKERCKELVKQDYKTYYVPMLMILACWLMVILL